MQIFRCALLLDNIYNYIINKANSVPEWWRHLGQLGTNLDDGNPSRLHWRKIEQQKLGCNIKWPQFYTSASVRLLLTSSARRVLAEIAEWFYGDEAGTDRFSALVVVGEPDVTGSAGLSNVYLWNELIWFYIVSPAVVGISPERARLGRHCGPWRRTIAPISGQSAGQTRCYSLPKSMFFQTLVQTGLLATGWKKNYYVVGFRRWI